MKRRDFLKKTMTSGTVLSSATLAGACKTTNDPSQPDPDPSSIKSQEIGPFNPQDPERLPQGVTKTVLVIGGGIAGMAAALKLAERGYRVTMREAAPFLGGRLHAREEALNVGTFQVEHGLHMWFYQYYNFKDILISLGLWDKYFVPFNEIFFTFKNYAPEVIKSEGPYPLNLLGIVKNSPNLNLLNALQTFRALPDIIFYNHKNHFAKFDDINFYDWANDTGVNQKFFDIIMQPAASVTLNEPTKISASEMILNMHFYFIGHPKAFQRWVTTTDHGTAVINPWAETLRELGTDIRLNSPVPGLRFENGACKGANDDTSDYDYVVVSTDVPGTKSIFENSKASDGDTTTKLGRIKQKFSGLKVAPSYRILRVWVDQPIASKLSREQAVIETPQHKPIALLAVFEMLEDESRKWAEENNGSILEFHLYNTPDLEGLSPREIWNRIRSEINGSFDQTEAKDLIRMANPIDFSMGSYENFTSYEVGQAKFKPEVHEGRKVGINNLFFAGDWVQYDPFPNALMERSVTTGIEAANNILLKDKVRQVTVKGANTRGPGAFPRF